MLCFPAGGVGNGEHAMARGVEPTHERCPGWGAVCRCGVSIGEGHTFLSDPVDVRRLVVAGTLAGEVGVAEVVGVKEDDIGTF